MKTIGWKLIAILYGIFVLLDLASLPNRDPFLPTSVGSILGLVALVPMVGYAFNIRVLNESLWKILFLIQALAAGLALGVLILAHLPFGSSRIEFSPITLLIIPAVVRHFLSVVSICVSFSRALETESRIDPLTPPHNLRKIFRLKRNLARPTIIAVISRAMVSSANAPSESRNEPFTMRSASSRKLRMLSIM